MLQELDWSLIGGWIDPIGKETYLIIDWMDPIKNEPNLSDT